MRAVLFDDANGKHTDSLRLVNGLHEVGGGELFPLGGKLGLGDCWNGKCEEKCDACGRTACFGHEASW